VEENMAWKIVFVASLFSLFVLGIAYYLISPKENLNKEDALSKKLIELKKTKIEGRSHGQKTWEFSAESGYTDRDHRITYLYHVYNGRMFSSGEVSVKDLSAPEMQISNGADIINANQPEAWLDFSRFSASSPKKEWVKVIAKKIRYDTESKKSEMSGKVQLIRRTSVLQAERIDVDHQQRMAKLSDQLIMTRRDGTIKADNGEYLGTEGQLKAEGQVKINLKDKNIITHIRGNSALIFDDQDKDISLNGSLEVIQGKKIAVAPYGVYSKMRGGLFLSGGSRAIFEKARTLLQSKTAEKLKDPEAKQILKAKTMIKSNDLFFSTRTGNALASGSVEVTQMNREARSDRAEYNDLKEIIILTGNVFMKRQDLKGKTEWIKCRQVTVSVKKETFEAVGGVEAEFKI
jgi:lipopolysaccharide assembly outer membrane protein LptD (OstA)